MKTPYKLFDKYLLRTPVFSVNAFFDFNNCKNITVAIEKLIGDNFFKEALFLASPDLYQRTLEWQNHKNLNVKDEQKLFFALFKYFSRMTSRSTPFGLFAGINMGKFAEKSQIELQDKLNFSRHTRLDMDYLVSLSQDLEKHPEIRNQIKFYTNTSIYKLADKLRYVEYHYIETRRMHEIISVDNDDYLQLILDKAQNGASINELANLLVDDEISIEEAIGFIDELTDSQLIVSELEPSVSGNEFLGHIISALQKIEGADSIVNILQDIDKAVKVLDLSVLNNLEQYGIIKETIDKLGTSYKDKFLLQTDLAIQTKSNFLRKSLQADFLDVMSFLNQITLKKEQQLLLNFGKKLHERFEERPIPLSLALDNEIGIKLGNANTSADINLLIDDLNIPKKPSKKTKKMEWDEVRIILHQKLREAQETNSNEMVLHKKDFPGLQADWSDLPDTMYSLIKLLKQNDVEKYYMAYVSGSSAANLLGRFCFVDEDAHKFVQEIVNKEALLAENTILAEIVHLPESRVGNILLRPELRKYEIPYLAKSVKPKQFQLSINDLYVVANHKGKIKLFSKSLNKEVLPHLTNAHNYTNNPLPIYHFLAMMQTQSKRASLGFNWGDLEELFNFFPRVSYKNAILSPAKWKIEKNEIQQWRDAQDDKHLLQIFSEWRRSRNIPQYVLFIQSDNKLLLDLTQLFNIKLLIDIIKKRNWFFVEEFLFEKDSFVKQNDDFYANEMVISFYNYSKQASR